MLSIRHCNRCKTVTTRSYRVCPWSVPLPQQQRRWLHSGPRTEGLSPANNLASYNATAIETHWQHQWAQPSIRPGTATATTSAADFTMLLPPPNVTGNLHCGHALTLAIQDALVRYHVLHNRTPLWIPGTDHAGIATQSVVERHLAKQGLSRHTLGRDRFLDHVWQWKHAHGDRIHQQTRALGAALAWDHAYFTLDAPRSRVVRDAFVALHDRGLVYRATRLVHWCPALRTAISDVEVDHVTIAGPTDVRVPGESAPVRVGEMHRFRYPLVPPPGSTDGDPGYIDVATTRIETMLGDAAVAVHPADTRYAHLVGSRVAHPLRPGVTLPVIADAAVDPALGTGAVKVTPAHDPDDFAMGARHGLPLVDLLSPKGTFTEACGIETCVGRSRFAVRAWVIEQLAAQGLYLGAQPHAMRLGVCSRSGDIIEPRVVPQWYVKCAPMADKVLAQMDQGKLLVVNTSGDNMEGELRAWLDKMQDWCVSRQLWWGHRIPAYRPAAGDESAWVVDRERPFVNGYEDAWVQDEDVLDTWFSSALLPLSATNPTVDVFQPRNLINYPTSVLETGHDILFFWVARMAMLCTELTGQVPFSKVLLHGMVRDAQGRKMSKSLGNVIDPLHVIQGRSLDQMLDDIRKGNLPVHEIERSSAQIKRQFPNGLPSGGADALRLTLLEHASSRQINLDVTKVVANHHFANKLVNVAKFVSSHLPAAPAARLLLDPTGLAPADHWLLARLHATLDAWHAGYTSGAVGRSTQAATHFLLTDLSDTYIEFAKRTHLSDGGRAECAAAAVLATAMEYALAVLHPTMPHVTSELAARVFGHARGVPPLDALPRLPEVASVREGAEVFEQVWAVVKTLRKVARAMDRAKDVMVVAQDAAVRAELIRWAGEVVRVGRVPSGVALRVVGAAAAAKGTTVVIRPELKVVYVPMEQVGQDVVKLQKEAERLAGSVRKLQTMMGSDKYLASVPEHVRVRDQRKVASFLERLSELAKVGVVPREDEDQ